MEGGPADVSGAPAMIPAFDQADAPPPPLPQHPPGQPQVAVKIELHRMEVGIEMLRAEAYRLKISPGQMDRVGLGPHRGRRQKNPADAAVPERSEHGGAAPALRPEPSDFDGHAALPGGRLQLPEPSGIKRIFQQPALRRPVVQQRHLVPPVRYRSAARPVVGQRAQGRIRLVAQLRGPGPHSPARRLPHTPRPAQGQRNRLLAEAKVLRQIFQGDAPAHGSPVEDLLLK